MKHFTHDDEEDRKKESEEPALGLGGNATIPFTNSNYFTASRIWMYYNPVTNTYESSFVELTPEEQRARGYIN